MSEKTLIGKSLNAAEIIGLSVCVILMFARCFFGTELTDEAYTVSDALAVMNGNIPYAYDSIVMAGMSFVPVVFYRIYSAIVPDMEGILLYSRLVFTAFRLVILAAVYILLRNTLDKRKRIFAVGCLIPYFGGYGLQDFSYNNLGSYLTLLSAVTVYSVVESDSKRESLKLFLAGVVSALAVFAHVAYSFAVIVFIILIFANSGEKKWTRAAIYCGGGIIQILIVFVGIIVQTGWTKLLYGLNTMLFFKTAGKIRNTLGDRIAGVLAKVIPVLAVMVIIALLIFLTIRIIKRKKKIEISNSDAWVMAVGMAGIISLLVFRFEMYSIACICFGLSALMIPVYRSRHDITWYILIYAVAYIAFLTIATSEGTSRIYFLIPTALTALVIMYRINNKYINTIATLIAVLLIIGQTYGDYSYVYRDEPISRLNTVVESGVYKGIFTTADRANDLVELEDYINSNINADESVSFRDNVPTAYLMRNRNICDIRTWDHMQWTYGCNDPRAMYRYYINTDRIPDVIMYVDYGRDDSLSIENSEEDFKYNRFVNTYYDFEEETQLNKTFRIKIYRKNNLQCKKEDLIRLMNN